MAVLTLGAVGLLLSCGCTGGPERFPGTSGPEPFVDEVQLAFVDADLAAVTTFLSMRAGLSLPPRDVEGLASARVSVTGVVPASAARSVLDAALACHRWRVEEEGGAAHLLPTLVGTMRTHDACDVRAIPVHGDAAALAAALAPLASPRGQVLAVRPDLVVLADVPAAAHDLVERLRQLDPTPTDAVLR